MERYKNLSGDSNVVAYEIGGDSIEVEFQGGTYRYYLYTYLSAGPRNVEQMKQLARQGRGLNTFINEHVRKAYARRR